MYFKYLQSITCRSKIVTYTINLFFYFSQYHLGQLYMIAKHSNEQSESGQGVEVVKNEECSDPVHGCGRYTEKRVHLSRSVGVFAGSILQKEKN